MVEHSDTTSILRLSHKVYLWTKKNRKNINGGSAPDTDWSNAVWFHGVQSYYNVSQRKELTEYLYKVGTQSKWSLGEDESISDKIKDLRQQTGPSYIHRYGDDHAIVQTYADLYEIDRDKKMILKAQKNFDAILASPTNEDLNWTLTNGKDSLVLLKEWAWCDALYMAAPAWAKMYKVTKKEKYLSFLLKKWKKTYDKLYDKNEHLFYRDTRYIGKKESNGEKVFWGRGNAWVLAGLARILSSIPKKERKHPRYSLLIKTYLEMSQRIIHLQEENGFWKASLLNPKSMRYGESSATSLLTYALAWGINHGYFDEVAYKQSVLKAWKALETAVHPSGRLGFVQRIGHNPKQASYESTSSFGAGAFLMAAEQMIYLNKGVKQTRL